MKVTVVGAGAIGGLAGAWMTMAGEDVTLVDIWREHVDAMKERGLFIDGERGEHHVPVRAMLPGEMTEPLELVFLACKSQHTRSAVESIRHLLTDRSAVVSLQNGMNEEVIGEVIGIERVIGAIPDYGGALVAPGHLEFVHPGPAYVGELDGSVTQRVQEAHRLLSLLTEAELTSNIVGRIWAKQIHSSPVVMTALIDAPIGDVLRLRWVRLMAVSLVAEGITVADKAGVTLPEGETVQPSRARRRDPRDTMQLIDDMGEWNERTERRQREQEASGAHQYIKKGSGMWWDLYYRHRASETQWITGTLIRHADELGVPVPLNRKTAEMIYELEVGTRHPSFANLKELYEFGQREGLLLPLA